MLSFSQFYFSASILLPHLVSGDNLFTEVAVENCSVDVSSMGFPVAVLSTALGTISNVVALLILVNAYCLQRRRPKATFLLFATSLVTTDLIGHAILGTLVIQLYLSNDASTEAPNGRCLFMGGSMVFFGLCPLFMGCAMAAERCLGVTKPLLHSSLVTKTRAKVCLAVIWMVALLVALLPSMHLSSYTYQQPGTWCFINVLNNTTAADVAFVGLFSGLGLTSLALSLVFNTISGLTLVMARLRRQPGSRHSTKSHDIEMVTQLVGIMVTSCICWSPLLIFGLISVLLSYTETIGYNVCSYEKLMLLGVRLATWNQILDPWVYILLRRTVLRKIYLIVKCQAGLRDTMIGRWEQSSIPSFHKNEVTQV